MGEKKLLPATLLYDPGRELNGSGVGFNGANSFDAMWVPGAGTRKGRLEILASFFPPSFSGISTVYLLLFFT